MAVHSLRHTTGGGGPASPGVGQQADIIACPLILVSVSKDFASVSKRCSVWAVQDFLLSQSLGCGAEPFGWPWPVHSWCLHIRRVRRALACWHHSFAFLSCYKITLFLPRTQTGFVLLKQLFHKTHNTNNLPVVIIFFL